MIVLHCCGDVLVGPFDCSGMGICSVTVSLGNVVCVEIVDMWLTLVNSECIFLLYCIFILNHETMSMRMGSAIRTHMYLSSKMKLKKKKTKNMKAGSQHKKTCFSTRNACLL